MQELPTSVLAALSELPPEVIKRILNKVKAKRVSTPKIPPPIIKSVTHTYVCEICNDTHIKKYPVKVHVLNKRGLAEYNEPITLYHVCNKCKSLTVVGIAYAMLMLENLKKGDLKL